MEDMKKGGKKEMRSEKADISPEKAKKILKDNSVHGYPLSDQQKKFFGVMAGKED